MPSQSSYWLYGVAVALAAAVAGLGPGWSPKGKIKASDFATRADSGERDPAMALKAKTLKNDRDGDTASLMIQYGLPPFCQLTSHGAQNCVKCQLDRGTSERCFSGTLRARLDTFCRHNTKVLVCTDPDVPGSTQIIWLRESMDEVFTKNVGVVMGTLEAILDQQTHLATADVMAFKIVIGFVGKHAGEIVRTQDQLALAHALRRNLELNGSVSSEILDRVEHTYLDESILLTGLRSEGRLEPRHGVGMTQALLAQLRHGDAVVPIIASINLDGLTPGLTE